MIQVWEGARQPDGSRMRVFEVARQPDRLNQGWIRGRFGHEDWQEVTHIRPFIEDAVVFKIELFPDAAVQTMCKDSILTRGHRRSKPQTKPRSSRVGEIIAESEHSIPITYNEAMWF